MLSLHIMKQYFFLFASFVMMYALTACSSANSVDYKIDGSSNISRMESDVMYLQTFDDVKLDSAKVIHGEFRFSNSLDNSRVAFLQMEGMMLPVVIENGDIVVNINTTGTVMKGTMLNDRLYHFMKVRDSLQYQNYELDREYTRAWMDDENMAEVVNKLGQQRKELNEQLDELITSSIRENYDNVLGPGIFMIQTWNIHPENYPWVTSIMTAAPESFKNDPYVQWYFQEVKRELNGSDMPMSAPSTDAAAQPQPTSKETTAQPSLSANPVDEEKNEAVAETTPVVDDGESAQSKEEK